MTQADSDNRREWWDRVPRAQKEGVPAAFCWSESEIWLGRIKQSPVKKKAESDFERG